MFRFVGVMGSLVGVVFMSILFVMVVIFGFFFVFFWEGFYYLMIGMVILIVLFLLIFIWWMFLLLFDYECLDEGKVMFYEISSIIFKVECYIIELKVYKVCFFIFSEFCKGVDIDFILFVLVL